LAPTATLSETIDVASQHGNLFSLPDYYASANEVFEKEKKLKSTFAVFDEKLPKDLLTKSKTVRACLAVTRCEALTLALFLPLAMSKYSVEDRDKKVRDLKSLCNKHGKYSSMFKPVHARAVEAMALI